MHEDEVNTEKEILKLEERIVELEKESGKTKTSKKDGSMFSKFQDSNYQKKSKLEKLQKSLKNGSFWIDPNRGYRSDAFRTQCHFLPKITKTCIKVKYDEFGIKNLDIGLSQFNFLFWHSLKVEQRLDIDCKNVLISDKLLKKGSLFETYEGVSLSEDEVRGIDNNCKEKSKDWKQSKIELMSTRPRRLPIKKVNYEFRKNLSNRNFKVQGELCFIEEFIISENSFGKTDDKKRNSVSTTAMPDTSSTYFSSETTKPSRMPTDTTEKSLFTINPTKKSSISTTKINS